MSGDFGEDGASGRQSRASVVEHEVDEGLHGAGRREGVAGRFLSASIGITSRSLSSSLRRSIRSMRRITSRSGSRSSRWGYLVRTSRPLRLSRPKTSCGRCCRNSRSEIMFSGMRGFRLGQRRSTWGRRRSSMMMGASPSLVRFTPRTKTARFIHTLNGVATSETPFG